MITAIKIQNGDGLFSTGGTNPNFTKRGKTWSQLGHVTSHLNLVDRIPPDWTIIVAKIDDDGFTPSELTKINAFQHMVERKEASRIRKEKEMVEIQKRRVEQSRRDLEIATRKLMELNRK